MLTKYQFLDKSHGVAYIVEIPKIFQRKLMRKEVLIAIGAGTIFGLVIAFGIWRLNSSIENGEAQENLPTPNPTPTNSEFGLTIAKPADLTVFSDSSITISGATKAGTYIVASGEEKDYFVKTREDGAFEATADLIGGFNQIIIASYDETGKSKQQTVSVVYSQAFSEAEEENSKESTESGDPVRQKVEEKVKEVSEPPVSYLGTVTDISGKTLNLKKEKGEISQVAVSDNTSYSSDLTKKDIKFGDVAIGDFVIAMGYKNGNEVLDARRILVTKEPSAPLRQIFFGKVKEIKSRELTLTKTDGNNTTLTFPKTWKGPEIKEIEDQSLAIIVSLEGDRTQIRSIEILK